VLGAQGARAARAHAAITREADDAGTRPRIRRLRSQPGRAGVAPAQVDRGRPAAAALHPDGVGRGLRVRAGRHVTRMAAQAPAARPVQVRPVRISLFWRTFLLLALLIGASLGATLGIAELLERTPPEKRLA